MIADSRATEMGGWIDSALAEVLADHQDGFEGMGFDQNYLQKILKRNSEETLKEQIETEEEYKQADDLAETIIRQVTAHVKHLAQTNPQDLRNAIMVVVNKGAGNSVIFMADPNTKDVVQELKRYAESGIKSPLEALTGAVWK